MYHIYDENLDNFLEFSHEQTDELLYYLINIHYDKYNFNSYQFKEELSF